MIKILVSLFLACLSASAVAAPSWEAFIASAAAKRLPAGVRVEVKDAHVGVPLAQQVRITSFVPEQPMGLVTFTVETLQDGKILEGRGSATLRVYSPVVVAAGPLAHGESLTAGNTKLEERELSRLSQVGYFTGLGALEGRTAKGQSATGQVLGKNNTQLAAVVTSGQSVELVRRKPSFVLKAKARALQSGRLGQWIPVQNTSSGKMIQARVTGPNEVEMN
ncbi:flagellar basal body P-ring formation chaperone FlgA [bacterium]|nr:flagellar basal body P-ring formation chaperone FlgA [bacterium]